MIERNAPAPQNYCLRSESRHPLGAVMCRKSPLAQPSAGRITSLAAHLRRCARADSTLQTRSTAMNNRKVLQQSLLLLFLLAVSGQSLLAQATYAQGRIDIGLVVSNLDRALAFYEQALGMQRAYSFDVDTAFARKSGLTAGAPLHAVAMRLTTDDKAPVLKLVRSGDPDTYQPNFINNQSGVRYLTVFVRAVAPIMERLKHHDVAVLGDGPVPLSNGQFLALVQDPDGVFVELIGPMHAPDSP